MKTKALIRWPVLFSLMTCTLAGCTQQESPCSEEGNRYYFGTEINGHLCGYAMSKECIGTEGSGGERYELNDILLKLSVLGAGLDVRIGMIYGFDTASGKVISVYANIRSGNGTVISRTLVRGDTIWFKGNSRDEEQRIPLTGEVILESMLRSPHLLKDFIRDTCSEKIYLVFDPIMGEVIEKKYIKTGEEVIHLNDTTYRTIVLEETDLSNGTRSTVWLNTADGMTVKTIVGNRHIFLTDPSVINRISKVNYDDVIFARVDKIIENPQKLTWLKVKAHLISQGEILSSEGLNFPGQKFTGTVTDNVVEGIFEIEPLRYDGTNAPPFPPGFSSDPALKKYLEPEMMIESNDPVLVGEAIRITKGSADSWEAAKRLSRWVAVNIEGAIPGGGTARNTYKTKQGECGGHSRLLTAFCRAVGIPARLSIGCMYTTYYSGSFGQHAWTEIYMGDAGWVAVDATAFEIDYINAGHIRLGERTSFQPKEMEILDYRTDSGQTAIHDIIPDSLKPYIGKYTDMERIRVFGILFQDGGLSIDLPGQMILQLEPPDMNGERYPKMTRQISISFLQNTAGLVEKLIIRQKLHLNRKEVKRDQGGDLPGEQGEPAGIYTFPQGKTIEVLNSGGHLLMADPLGRTKDSLEFSQEGSLWTESNGLYELRPVSNDKKEITGLHLIVVMSCPRGEPAANVIEPLILESGAGTGLEKYEAMKESGSREYLFSERLMNSLGYRLLSRDKTGDAIEIFKYNAEEYPDSFNVYDSLGEAYYKNGNTELAIENFERSLDLNPGNANGRAMLEKIRAGN